MTRTEILNAITNIIGQTGVSSPYINDSQLITFIDEGIDGICRFGKVYPLGATMTVVTGICAVETKTVGGRPVVDVFDVTDATGKSLTRIRPWEQGRALGEVAGTPLWWYYFGGYVYINPPPAAGSSAWGVSAYVIAPTLANPTDEPAFSRSYHYALVAYGCYRAKQATGRYDEAAVHLKQYLDFIKTAYNQRTATLRGFTRGVDLMAAKQGATLGGAQ